MFKPTWSVRQDKMSPSYSLTRLDDAAPQSAYAARTTRPLVKWFSRPRNISECDMTDEDVDGGDLASCLDAAGRENVVFLDLGRNALTTLPDGIFADLTAMETL